MSVALSLAIAAGAVGASAVSAEYEGEGDEAIIAEREEAANYAAYVQQQIMAEERDDTDANPDHYFDIENGVITKYSGKGGDIDLTTLKGPNGQVITGIGDGAFAWAGLTKIIIPNTVTHIGYSAFAGNEFTSVLIPDSVTSIVAKQFKTHYKAFLHMKKSMHFFID